LVKIDWKMSYVKSTQYTDWKFDENELERLRTNANAKGVEGWTVQHSLHLERYYTRKIQEICNLLKYPEKIQATAIVYFKRFYLFNCMLEYPPKVFMLTCIYLSCKVEENHVDAKEFGQHLNQDGTLILQSEILVLKILKFHLNIFHPYKPAFGFIANMQEKKLLSKELADRLVNGTNSLIHDSLNTDLCFIFPPSQIALAAICVASKIEKNIVDVYKYMQDSLGTNPNFFNLKENVQKIEKILSQKILFPTQEDISNLESNFSSLKLPSI